MQLWMILTRIFKRSWDRDKIRKWLNIFYNCLETTGCLEKKVPVPVTFRLTMPCQKKHLALKKNLYLHIYFFVFLSLFIIILHFKCLTYTFKVIFWLFYSNINQLISWFLRVNNTGSIFGGNLTAEEFERQKFIADIITPVNAALIKLARGLGLGK